MLSQIKIEPCFKLDLFFKIESTSMSKTKKQKIDKQHNIMEESNMGNSYGGGADDELNDEELSAQAD